MSGEITVPAMGESITEATVGEILKPEGSVVKMDDELLELETDKVNQVLYAKQGGTVSYSIKTGDVVKIGQQIGTINESAARSKVELGVQVDESVEEPREPKGKKEVEEKGDEAADATSSEKIVHQKVQPRPKKMEISGVRETKEDYLTHLAESSKHEIAQKSQELSKKEQSPKTQEYVKQREESYRLEEKERPPTPPKTEEYQKPLEAPRQDRGETRHRISKIRQVIGQRLVEVQNQTAMLTTFNEVDMSTILHLREEFKEPFLKVHGVKLGLMPFFVNAAVSALQAFPDVNSYLEGEELVHREYYDIGVAVSTDRGLVVPVVRGCDRLSFPEIEKRIAEFVTKAREGGLALSDLQGGGFTITNGGIFGSLLSTPILNPPQCAILGMHKIQKRAVVIDDKIEIRPMMYLAMSYDHRIIDGKEAVSFLLHIKKLIEEPSRILLRI